MPNKPPDLETKYEKTDPSYKAGSSSSSSQEPSRVQPPRKTKPSIFENVLSSVSHAFGHKEEHKEETQTSESPDAQASVHSLETQVSIHPPEVQASVNSPEVQTSVNSPERIVSEQTGAETPVDLESHTTRSFFEFGERIPTYTLSIDEEEQSFETNFLLFFDLQSAVRMANAEIVTAIVTQVMKSLGENKTSDPKSMPVDKLTMSNYSDWKKKMKYALTMSNLWLNPSLDVGTLTEQQKVINAKACLFMALHLDEQNSAFVNEKNETDFISAWNSIKSFHQPNNAVVLTDIIVQIQDLRHVSGQPIESHLLKLEAQFARLAEIEETLNEKFLAGFILASVSKSPEFSNLFNSAMWSNEEALTVTKVKTVLISTQRRQRAMFESQAHGIQRSFQQNNHPSTSKKRDKRLNRPHGQRVYNCPYCKMDNHTEVVCYKKKKDLAKGLATDQRRANHADQADTNFEQPAQAFAGHGSQRSLATVPVKQRLGPQVAPKSPYYGIQPKRFTSERDEDTLEINFNPNEISHDMYSSGKTSMKHNKLTSSNVTSPKSIQTHHSEHQYVRARMNNVQQCTKEMKSKEEFKMLNYQENSKPTKSNNSPITSCHMSLEANKIKDLFIEESSWIVDSGATQHMCNSSQLVSEFKPSLGHTVMISDGTSVPIHGYGILKFSLWDEQRHVAHNFVLHNVAVVPAFAVNLISVRALAEQGVTVKFTDRSCYIKHPSATFLFAKIYKSSYILTIRSKQTDQVNKTETAMVCCHEWHRRMGHKNIAHVKKVKEVLDLKMSKCDCSDECIGCLKGKLHALPYPQISEKPQNPRDVITTDVCGPFQTTSLGGAKYFVTFTCANTDYTEVATLKCKSDCKTELTNYIMRCKTQFGQFPKIVRSDQGGEYVDYDVQSFLKANGIKPEYSVARCSQQNGISERKNRTLVEAVRTMIITKNLPHYLWGEALMHATNTFNNIPKGSESKSPKEKFFGKSFKYRFIEFGSPVYYTTNPINRSKLAERGAFGMFVGHDHNSKGFRIYSNGRIRVERHVRFVENPETVEHHNPSEPSEVLLDNNSEEAIPTNNLRRSERIRMKQANAVTSEHFEPKTYKQAITCPDSDKWLVAMSEELRSIDDNNTWSLVELPKGKNLIGSKWVFKVKESDTNVRYKARLVAQGFTQKFGVDYDEVFAPVTRSSTFRILLSIASARKLTIQQYDVKTAFLNGHLKEEIYMRPPKGFTETEKVLKLHKSLYGLKQAAKVWNETFHKAMTDEGFTQSKYDECLYLLSNGNQRCYAIVHVDDILFASDSLSLIKTKTDSLNKYFELKCLGDIQNYLGIEVSKDINGIYSISQTHYIDKIAKEFQLENTKGSKYPLDPGYHKLDDDNELESNSDYRKLIGMLLYISTNTRLDIAAAVGILAQRISKPRRIDYTEALRIVKYLVSTKSLKLSMLDINDRVPLQAYADADWAEDRITRKSISGLICKVFGAPVSWSSRRQDSVSKSTTEAEFYAISEAVSEVQWIENVLHEFEIKVESPVIIYSDNQSTIKLVENSKFSARTKHIDVRLHYVRDCSHNNKVKINYCPTENNVADILTKPLSGVRIRFLRELASLH
jgi:transposase InsO family protein